jgi:hypothetical protein
MFYVAGVLNAIYLVMLFALVFCACAYFGTLISDLFDNPRKIRKISTIVGSVCLLWVLFVPSGDTYLKMKFGEDRMEVLMNVLDEKVLSTIETTELIDYE